MRNSVDDQVGEDDDVAAEEEEELETTLSSERPKYCSGMTESGRRGSRSTSSSLGGATGVMGEVTDP
jgi:hypothetical protein